MSRRVAGGALPTFVVIGAMKCGTTAMHSMLDRHPRIAMSDPKELNFFFGAAPPGPGTVDPWSAGNWWRGIDWYAGHFSADVPVRGESSPGYTSPDHPEVAARLAATLPDARLVYLVRDPIERAVSQYNHHRRDGAEPRPPTTALLDPDSQYLARSRYHQRLVPFLDHVPRDQIAVVAMEDLRDEPSLALDRLGTFLGATDRRLATPGASWRCPRPATRLAPALHGRLHALLADDVRRLRALTGHAFDRWSL